MGGARNGSCTRRLPESTEVNSICTAPESQSYRFKIRNVVGQIYRPTRSRVNPATHFEQIYERALAAAHNATLAFNHANQLSQSLRRTANSAEQLRQQTIDQDRSYRNRLIEFFGTPYQGQIGPGKMYPTGYTGPDLYLHMYMPTLEISGDTVPKVETDIYANFEAFLKLDTNLNPFLDTPQPAPDYTKTTLSKFFPKDVPEGALGVAESPFYHAMLPLHIGRYAFQAPADWGERASPGKMQAALSDLLQAQHDLLVATESYQDLYEDMQIVLRVFTAKTGITAAEIKVIDDELGKINGLNESIETWEIIKGLATGVTDITEAVGDFWDSGFKAMPAKGWHAIATAARVVAEAGIVIHIAGFERRIREAEKTLEVDPAKFDLKRDIVDALAEIETLVNAESGIRIEIFGAIERLRAAGDRYRATLEEGNRLVEERIAFNKRVASTTTQQRYEDYTFRIARNDALTKFSTSFDLAARYAWLASKAYAYELNLPDNHAASATPISTAILRSRTLGRFDNGQPVIGHGGIAEQLAVLKANFDVFKGQLGFNNPANQVVNFSLRAELGRVGLANRVNDDWRAQLETYRVADLWNYSYSRDGVDYGQVYRRYCRPFAPEAAGPQPALVIPFSTTVTAGQNWFGHTLTGGDSTFTASNFATKVRSAGVKFESYNAATMSMTPQVYLVPIGLDRMYLPESNELEARSWRVLDQRIPVPLAVTPSNLSDPGWLPFTGSTSGYFEEARRHPAFRAYHDAGGYSNTEMLHSSRLVGRSVWNTQWVLITPASPS